MGALEAKVRARAAEKNYSTVDDIYNDIVDLAGIRVALYFPEQRTQADELIRLMFDVLETRTFPDPNSQPSYTKRFSGYWAAHYRVKLADDSLSDSEKRYADARLEIQVASVLMHAWSEVEHDLVYKPLHGKLSAEEYDILDELNGLVIAGELALKRLEGAGQLRVQHDRAFGNHYELATFLLANVPTAPGRDADKNVGSVDILFALLSSLGLATPDHVRSYLPRLHITLEERPISEQIIDQLLLEDATRYAAYRALRDTATGEATVEYREALGFFMSQWIAVERAIRAAITGTALGPLLRHSSWLSQDSSTNPPRTAWR